MAKLCLIPYFFDLILQHWLLIMSSTSAGNKRSLQACFKQTFPSSRKFSGYTAEQMWQLSEGHRNKILTDKRLQVKARKSFDSTLNHMLLIAVGKWEFTLDKIYRPQIVSLKFRNIINKEFSAEMRTNVCSLTLDILHTKLCFTDVNVTLAHIAICFWMYTPSQTPAMIS